MASYLFLILLFLSFVCNGASAFTTAYSRRLGKRGGQLASTILRSVLGLPLLGVAFVLAAGQQAPRLVAPSSWIDAVGWFLIIVGVALILWSLAALRVPAAAPSMADALVRQGPYAFVRHPLYDGVYFELAGAFLLRPTWPLTLCCLLAAGWLMIQARLEERDLCLRLPGYSAYMAQVPRFIPRIRA